MLSLNCERTYGLTEVPASIYDRKTDARRFDTIHDILRCRSPAESLVQGRNAPVWRIGNRGVNYSICSHFHFSQSIVNLTLTLIGGPSGGFVSSTTWATSAGLIFPHFRRWLAALSISLGPFLFPEKCCRIRICKPLPRKLQAK